MRVKKSDQCFLLSVTARRPDSVVACIIYTPLMISSIGEQCYTGYSCSSTSEKVPSQRRADLGPQTSECITLKGIQQSYLISARRKNSSGNSFVDQPRSCVVYNFGCVCLYVCQMITFEGLDVGSSYLHMRHISVDYGFSLCMVIGSRSRSQEPKRLKILFPQCKTVIGNNSRSIKHGAMMFACSMGFSGTVA